MDKVNLDTWFSQVELSARGLIEPSAYLGPYDVRNVYRDEDPDVLDFARRHACAELTDCGPQILQRDLKNVFLSDADHFSALQCNGAGMFCFSVTSGNRFFRLSLRQSQSRALRSEKSIMRFLFLSPTRCRLVI